MINNTTPAAAEEMWESSQGPLAAKFVALNFTGESKGQNVASVLASGHGMESQNG